MYRTPEFHVVHRHEIDHLAGRVGYLIHHQESARLGHPLYDQHTRHDRVAREVAVEERLVDRDVLKSQYPAARLELQNPIDEQEWVPVRQEVENALRLEHRASVGGFESQSAKTTGDHHVSAVAGTVGHYVRPEATSGQGQIAHDIDDLVSYEFIGKPQLDSVRDSIICQGDRVLEARSEGQAPGVQGLGPALQPERSGRCDVRTERLGVDFGRGKLASNHWMIEIDSRAHPVAIVW